MTKEERKPTASEWNIARFNKYVTSALIYGDYYSINFIDNNKDYNILNPAEYKQTIEDYMKEAKEEFDKIFVNTQDPIALKQAGLIKLSEVKRILDKWGCYKPNSLREELLGDFNDIKY